MQTVQYICIMLGLGNVFGRLGSMPIAGTVEAPAAPAAGTLLWTVPLITQAA